jgi:hypothetical protein
MDLLRKKGIRLTKKTRLVAEKSIEDYVPEEKIFNRTLKLHRLFLAFDKIE